MTSYTLLNWDGSQASSRQHTPDAAGLGSASVSLNPNQPHHPHNQTTALNNLNTSTAGVGVQPVNPHTTTVSTVGPLTSDGGTGRGTSAGLLQALVDYGDDSDMDVSVDGDVGVQQGATLNDAHGAFGVEPSVISAKGVQEQAHLTNNTRITLTNTSQPSSSTTLQLSRPSIGLPNPPTVHSEPMHPQIHPSSTSKSMIQAPLTSTPIVAPTPTIPPLTTILQPSLTPPTLPPIQAQAQTEVQPQPQIQMQPRPESFRFLNDIDLEFRPEVNSPLHANITAPMQPTQPRNADAESSTSMPTLTSASSSLASALSLAPTPATPGTTAITTTPTASTTSSVLIPNPTSSTSINQRRVHADLHELPQVKPTPQVRGENTGMGRGGDRDDVISINTDDGEGESEGEVEIVSFVYSPSKTHSAQPKAPKPPRKAAHSDGRSKSDAEFKTDTAALATPHRSKASGMDSIGVSKQGLGTKPPGTSSKPASSRLGQPNSSPSKPALGNSVNSKAGPSKPASSIPGPSKLMSSKASTSTSLKASTSKQPGSRPTSSMASTSKLGMSGSMSSKPSMSTPSSARRQIASIALSKPPGSYPSSSNPSSSKPANSKPSTSGPSLSGASPTSRPNPPKSSASTSTTRRLPSGSNQKTGPPAARDGNKTYASRERHEDRPSDSLPASRPIYRSASDLRPASRMDSAVGVVVGPGGAFPRASGSTYASPVKTPAKTHPKTPAKTPAKAVPKPVPPPPAVTERAPSPHLSPLFTPNTTPQSGSHPGDYDLSKLFTPEQSPVSVLSVLSVLSSDEARSRAKDVRLGKAPGSGSVAHGSAIKRKHSISLSHTKTPRAQDNSDSRPLKNTAVTHAVVPRPVTHPHPSTSTSTYPKIAHKPKSKPNSQPLLQTKPYPKARPRHNFAYVSIPALKRPEFEYVKYEREAKLVAKMRGLGMAIETERFLESMGRGTGSIGFGGWGVKGGIRNGGVKERKEAKEKGGEKEKDGVKEKTMVGDVLGANKVQLSVKDGKKRKRDDGDDAWDDSDMAKGAGAGERGSGMSPKKIQKLGKVTKSKAKAKAHEREDDVIDLTMDDVDDQAVSRPGPKSKTVLRDTANAETPVLRPATKPASAAAGPKSRVGTTSGLATGMPPPSLPSRSEPLHTQLKAKDTFSKNVGPAGPKSHRRPIAYAAARATAPQPSRSEKATVSAVIDVDTDDGSVRALSPLSDVSDISLPAPVVGRANTNSPAPIALSSTAVVPRSDPAAISPPFTSISHQKPATPASRYGAGTAGPSNHTVTPTVSSGAVHRRLLSAPLISSPTLSADADAPTSSLLFSAFEPPLPHSSSASQKKSKRRDEPEQDREYKRRKHNNADHDMGVDAANANMETTSTANSKSNLPASRTIKLEKSGSKSIWASSAVPITSQREANHLCPAVTRLNLNFEFPSGRARPDGKGREGKDGKENEVIEVGMMEGHVEQKAEQAVEKVGMRTTGSGGYDSMKSVYWRPAGSFFDVKRKVKSWDEDWSEDDADEDQSEGVGGEGGGDIVDVDVGPEGEYGLGLQLSLTRRITSVLKWETMVPIGEFWDEVVVPSPNRIKTSAPLSKSKAKARISNTAPPPYPSVPYSSLLPSGATTRSEEGYRPHTEINDQSVLDSANSAAGSSYGTSPSAARTGDEILSAKALGKRKAKTNVTTTTTNDAHEDDEGTGDSGQHSNDTPSLVVAAMGVHSAFSQFRPYPVGSALLGMAPFSVNTARYTARQRIAMTTPLKDKQLDIFIHQYTDMSPESPFGDQGEAGDTGDTDLMDVVTTSMSTSESSHVSGAHNDMTDEYRPDTLSDVSHALFSEVMGGAGGSMLDFQSEMEIGDQMQTQLWDAYEFDPVERAGDGFAAPTVGASGVVDGRFTTIDPTLLGGGASAEEVLEAGMAVAERSGEWELDATMEEEEEEEENDCRGEEEHERGDGERADSEYSDESDDSDDEEVVKKTFEKQRESPSVNSPPHPPSPSGPEYVGGEGTQPRKSTRERKESERKREAARTQSSEPAPTRKFNGVVLSDKEADADTRLATYESLTSDMDKLNNPGDNQHTYCHQCRRPANIVMLACNTCRKSFCIRCLALRYVALEFDMLPSVFTCPSCIGFCNCTAHARKRNEEYISGIIYDAPLLFDDDSDTSSPPPPAPAVQCFNNSAPIPSNVEYWGAIYNLQGEKIGSAVVAQNNVVSGHIPVEYAHTPPCAIVRQPPAKRKRTQTQTRPKRSDGARVFVGIAQRCWGLGSQPKTKVLDKIPRVKKGVHSYVGNSKLLKCRIIPSQLDDVSDLSSLPSSDEEESEDEAVEKVDSVSLEPTPDPVVSSGGMEADDVARAISMALEACGHFTKT